jgi:hypothetical protein
MPEQEFIETEGDLVTAVGWGHTEVSPLVLGNLTEGIDSSPSDTLQKNDVRYTFDFNEKNTKNFNLSLVELQTCQQTFSGLNIDIRKINMCAKSSSGNTCRLVKKHSIGG